MQGVESEAGVSYAAKARRGEQMKRWKPVNAFRHLSWHGRGRAVCWRCHHWTGARSAGLVVCGMGEASGCRYRRVGLRTLLSRWWGLRNPPHGA